MATIMAVDDDERIQELLPGMLRRKGLHVLMASSGKTASNFSVGNDHTSRFWTLRCPTWMGWRCSERFGG